MKAAARATKIWALGTLRLEARASCTRAAVYSRIGRARRPAWSDCASPMDAPWQAATTIAVTATQRGMRRGITKESIMLASCFTSHSAAPGAPHR